MKSIKIGKKTVGPGNPTYTIAEIGSNFDRSMDRAKSLIDLAESCGADAVKFQSFVADKIVSEEGFKALKLGFQAKWDKPVVEVYKDAEFPIEWYKELADYTHAKGMDFFSTPYDLDAVDVLDELNMPVYKIGSGDITWHEMLRKVASKGKPIILATGASTLAEIDQAMEVIRKEGVDDIILLQCVTNYPNSFESANLLAMKKMGEIFDVPYGYSDHTPGSVVPLGAVALGGCLIEKHFTDDKNRKGPDHPFAMDGKDFKEMVDQIRLLEKALGSPWKKLYEEETETVILQRRCIRFDTDVPAGTVLTKEMLTCLRPAPKEAIDPRYLDKVIGKTVRKDVQRGSPLTWESLS